MALDAVIFGIMQGIFEWLPISSQGNLVLAMVGLFGYDAATALNYAIFLHLGTVFAAIVYFRKEIMILFKSLKTYKLNSNNENHRTINFLAITTFLTGIVGLPVYIVIRNLQIRGEIFIAFVGTGLIFTGLVQRFIKVKGHNSYKDLNWLDSTLLGIAQAFSAIPGISRSGITTAGLIFRNYSAETALSLSFLMSIPAVLGAEIGLALLTGGFAFASLDRIIVGLVFSFAFGLVSIHVLMKVASKIKFWLFCIVLGLISLVPLLGLLL